MAQDAAARNASVSKSVTPKCREFAPERLEHRVFLSADPVIATVSWNGQDLRAIAGSYVALTKGTADFTKLAAKAGFTDVKLLQADGFYSFSTTKTPAQIKAWAKNNKSKLEDVHPDFVYSYSVAPQETPNDPLYPGQYYLNNTGQTVPDINLLPTAGSGGLDFNLNPAAPGTPDADIDAPEAWAALDAMKVSGKKSVIAVLDSGVDVNHPDLINNIYANPKEISGTAGVDDDNNGFPDDVQGWDFFRNDNTPDDEGAGAAAGNLGHGTFVSGVIAAEENNNTGVAGVAHNTTEILPLKVGGDVNGVGVISNSAALAAINYATAAKRLYQATGGAEGANVIVMNASFGGGPFLFDRITSRAIARAGDADILFVVAAGNEAIDTSAFADFPSRFSLNLNNVINVAATDKNDQLAPFSNFGAAANVAAPGVDILSTLFTPAQAGTDFLGQPTFTAGTEGYDYESGTSFSAPVVSGILALEYAANPSLNAAQLKDALYRGVDKIPSLGGQYNTPPLVTTGGRVNAYNAVRDALNTFVRNDDTRQGNWQGIYGKQGQYVVGDSQAAPAFVNVNFDGNNQFTPVPLTTDVRALQRTDGNGRVVGYLENPSQINFTLDFNDNQTHRVSFYVVDFEKANRQEAVEIVDTATGQILHGQVVSNFQNGRYLTYDLSGSVTVRITRQSGPDAVLSGIFFDPTPADQGAFVQADTKTQGNWVPVYGSEGFLVPGDRTSLPAGAAVTTSGATEQVIKASSKDQRALDKSHNPKQGVVDYLTAPQTFDVNVKFTDPTTGAADRFTSHRVSLYLLDFQKSGRAERVDLIDTNTGQLLDSRDVTDFRNGTYLTWDVRDAVTFRVTRLAGPSAVVSGVFFDASPGNPVAYVGEDRTTKGSWKGTYGAAGAYVVGDTNFSPSFLGSRADAGADPLTGGPDIRLSLSSGAVLRTVNPHTKNKTGVQRFSRPGDRTVSYFQGANFSFDLNFNDLNTHRVSIYVTDFDKKHRVQTVSLVDPVSGKVLSTRQVANFQQGVYVTWDVIGPVRVVVHRVAGPNAVVSGVFFD